MKSYHCSFLILVWTFVLTSSIATVSFRTNAHSLKPPIHLATTPIAKKTLHHTTSSSSSFVVLRGGSSSEDTNDNTPIPNNDVQPTTPTISTTPPPPPAAGGMGPNSTPPGFLRSILPSFPWNKLPNYLTYARCLAIPAIVAQFYLSPTSPLKNIHTSLIFSLASITDWLDGYLARRWDITSSFGAFLDPVADKLMVSTTLVLLSGKYGTIVALPSAIILAREIAVSALREWMAGMGQRDAVKVGFQGKVKTAATMLSLAIVTAVPDGVVGGFGGFGKMGTVWEVVATGGLGLLYLSAVVTVTSGSVYFKAAAPVFFSGSEEE